MSDGRPRGAECVMKEDDMTKEPIKAEIILYQSDGTNVPVPVLFQAETFWLTQQQMADLFERDKSTISRHLKNIFDEGELDEESVVAVFATTAADGKTYQVTYYDLDAVISVGYRVNSLRATRFRQWATSTLREYITKGFVLNDEMLKNGQPFGKDYFDELLARIRDIRASERRVWLKITDIFEECSFDYDPDSETAHRFYATVQNKMHYAVTGKTAAEIIMDRADASLPHMGLTTWKGAPDGRIHSSDVTVAKNYLKEDEIDVLNRLVTMLLDDIELRAKDGVLTSMEECAAAVDGFLAYNRKEILQGKGQRNRKQAVAKAKAEFAKFQKTQDRTYLNGFEREMHRIEGRK